MRLISKVLKLFTTQTLNITKNTFFSVHGQNIYLPSKYSNYRMDSKVINDYIGSFRNCFEITCKIIQQFYKKGKQPSIRRGKQSSSKRCKTNKARKRNNRFVRNKIKAAKKKQASARLAKLPEQKPTENESKVPVVSAKNKCIQYMCDKIITAKKKQAPVRFSELPEEKLCENEYKLPVICVKQKRIQYIRSKIKITKKKQTLAKLANLRMQKLVENEYEVPMTPERIRQLYKGRSLKMKKLRKKLLKKYMQSKQSTQNNTNCDSDRMVSDCNRRIYWRTGKNVNFKQEVTDEESKKNLSDFCIKQEANVLDSKNNLSNVSIKQEDNDVDSEKNLFDVRIKQEASNLDSNKDPSNVRIKQEASDVDSKKKLSDVFIKQEDSNVGSEKSISDARVKQEPIDVKSKKNLISKNLKPETSNEDSHECLHQNTSNQTRKPIFEDKFDDNAYNNCTYQNDGKNDVNFQNRRNSRGSYHSYPRYFNHMEATWEYVNPPAAMLTPRYNANMRNRYPNVSHPKTFSTYTYQRFQDTYWNDNWSLAPDYSYTNFDIRGAPNLSMSPRSTRRLFGVQYGNPDFLKSDTMNGYCQKKSYSDIVKDNSKGDVKINVKEFYNQSRPEIVTSYGKWIKDGWIDERAKVGIFIKVLSYNILAQELLEMHKELYTRNDPKYLTWDYRSEALIEEMKNFNADVLCLQEVDSDKFDFYVEHLGPLGYEGKFKKRTGDKSDGLAIFYRCSEFVLSDVATVEYYQPDIQLLDRDNVGLIVRLSPKNNLSKSVVVGTTHLLFNPKRQDIKLAQTQMMLAELERIAFSEVTENNEPTYHPIILTGDFNSSPRSASYQLVTSGKAEVASVVSNRYQETQQLLPIKLAITDNCQHYNLKNNREVGKSESSTFQHVKLYNSDRKSFSKLPMTDNMIKKEELSNNFGSGSICHNLRLKCVYPGISNAVDCTTNQKDWCTVDYIFYGPMKHRKDDRQESEGELKLVSYLKLPSTSEAARMGKIPNEACASDHFPLLATFHLPFSS